MVVLKFSDKVSALANSDTGKLFNLAIPVKDLVLLDSQVLLFALCYQLSDLDLLLLVV